MIIAKRKEASKSFKLKVNEVDSEKNALRINKNTDGAFLLSSLEIIKQVDIEL